MFPEDETFMRAALDLAEAARRRGEVPVAAGADTAQGY